MWDDSFPLPTFIPTSQAVKHNVWNYWVFYISPSNFTRGFLGLRQWGRLVSCHSQSGLSACSSPCVTRAGWTTAVREIQIHQMCRQAGHLLLSIPTGCLTALKRTHTPRDDFPGGPSLVQLQKIQNLPGASGGLCVESSPHPCPELLGPWSVLSTQEEPPEK